MRAKVGMSQLQFAGLLGVSAPAVAKWEKKTGAIRFQARTLDAWNRAAELTKRKAWRALKGS
jgi:transcriptional regulator with XRE-family HTH domain